MEQSIKELKDNMLKDYKVAVLECLHYTYISSFKKESINIIKKEYNISFTDNYNNFVSQFENFKLEDFENILDILDIESESDRTNANRCEATALILLEYLKK